eukprot:4354001-Prymnesium_polylepis.1
MSGFVWVKTIKGARTTGFFALQVSDGKLYVSDGTCLDPPSGNVMIFGEEFHHGDPQERSAGHVRLCVERDPVRMVSVPV